MQIEIIIVAILLVLAWLLTGKKSPASTGYSSGSEGAVGSAAADEGVVDSYIDCGRDKETGARTFVPPGTECPPGTTVGDAYIVGTVGTTPGLTEKETLI